MVLVGEKHRFACLLTCVLVLLASCCCHAQLRGCTILYQLCLAFLLDENDLHNLITAAHAFSLGTSNGEDEDEDAGDDDYEHDVHEHDVHEHDQPNEDEDAGHTCPTSSTQIVQTTLADFQLASSATTNTLSQQPHPGKDGSTSLQRPSADSNSPIQQKRRHSRVSSDEFVEDRFDTFRKWLQELSGNCRWPDNVSDAADVEFASARSPRTRCKASPVTENKARFYLEEAGCAGTDGQLTFRPDLLPADFFRAMYEARRPGTMWNLADPTDE